MDVAHSGEICLGELTPEVAMNYQKEVQAAESVLSFLLPVIIIFI